MENSKKVILQNLTLGDIDRKVVYLPSAKYGQLEEGRITSFNDHFVFVDYSNSGRGVATNPFDLEFLS